MTVVDVMRPAATVRPGTVSEFCRRTLACIPRADQRRWAELYVRGLVCLPGRKSVSHIAGLVAETGAEQAIQQFVNQSPWDWRPVRADLARLAAASLRPRAWAVGDIALPKNGSASVGVERQYAHSLGRVVNCQAGLGLYLVGSEAATPVTWRLRLPPSWDDDRARRVRAHLPEQERHQARWEYVLAMIDEALGWELPAAPIVLDSSHDPQAERLIQALEQRSLSYIVRVGAGVRLSDWGESALTAGMVAAAPGHGAKGATLRAAGAVAGAAGMRYTLCRLPPAAGSPARPRQLLVESRSGRRPGGLWLTNLGSLPLPRLVGLAGTVARVAGEMEQARGRFGFGHFEGRSYRGWHHHATLVSLAHAYVNERRLREVPTMA